MKKIILLGGMMLVAVTAAQATFYTYTWTHTADTFANGGVIPDGNPTGWSDSRSISISGNDEIVDVDVRLKINGGYNGDLFGYLVHSSGYVVLLNRSGKTSGDPFGYGDAGYDITLSDQAGNGDIHVYGGNSGNQLTGTWAPDGRTANPATVTDASTRTTSLANFDTLGASGTWTLFLADMSGGSVSTIESWGLDINVVPEPTTWALIIFGAVLGGVQLRRYWLARRTA